MALNRNEIIQALTARLSTIPEFKTVSRIYKDVAPENQPALFIRVVSQDADTSGPRTFWRIGCVAVVYVYEDSEGGAAVPLQTLIDRIEAALEAQPLEPHDPKSGASTLDGLVHYCRIAGGFEIQEGDLGKEAFAEIPIEIGVLA